MYLQDWLHQIPLKESIDYLREYLYCTDGLTSEEQFYLYTHFLETLNNIEKVPSNDFVLLGVICKDCFEVSDSVVRVSGYSLSEINSCKDEICRIARYNKFNIWPLWYEDIFVMDNRLPDGYGFDFCEWKEVLGWKVDEKNIKEVGEAAFGAYILEELSFNGITEDGHLDRLQQMHDRIAEYEEIMKLPEEEREEYFVKSVVDLGDFEEEDSKDQDSTTCDLIYNCISKAQMLKKFMKW